MSLIYVTPYFNAYAQGGVGADNKKREDRVSPNRVRPKLIIKKKKLEKPVNKALPSYEERYSSYSHSDRRAVRRSIKKDERLKTIRKQEKTESLNSELRAIFILLLASVCILVLSFVFKWALWVTLSSAGLSIFLLLFLWYVISALSAPLH